MQYVENLINIKRRGRGCGPIILRKYVRKYGRIGASYTDDLGRRLEALVIFKRARFNRRSQRPDVSVEQFIASLYSLADSCDYGSLRD